jgi:hypothetical protein
MLDLRMRGVGELPELPRDKEGNLLADVHRVVADPLELARHHVHADAPLQHGLVVRGVQHLLQHAAVQLVDGVVQLGEPACQLEVAAGKGVHRGADHPQCQPSHLLEAAELFGFEGRPSTRQVIFARFTA